MAAGESIHINMDPELIRILKRECLEHEITVSKFVECLVAKWLAEQCTEPTSDLRAEGETEDETEQQAA